MQSPFIQYQSRLENNLKRLFNCTQSESILSQAMAYACLDGGKRIRGTLVYIAGKSNQAHLDSLDAAAMAIELIHAYSLIHDDLPAMDDDAMRRGKPSCHVQYGEAMAILAGDALQALAFEILQKNQNIQDSDTKLKQIGILASAAGPLALCDGQALDINPENSTQTSLSLLESIHRKKTGALIKAAVKMGTVCGPTLNPERQKALDIIGEGMGLAFQVKDDILDVEGNTEVLGKQQGSDAALDKMTYVSLLGLEGAKNKLEQLIKEINECLEILGDSGQELRQIVSFIYQRNH